MKEIYKLIITLLGEVEYEGLIAQINNKIYIRSQIDKDEYEAMIKELLTGIGDIKVKKSPDHPYDFFIEQKKFNSLEEFFIELKESGFEIEYKKIEDNYKTFSLVAEGDDLSPETIAYLKEGTLLINLAQRIFTLSNNVYYEPKLNLRTGSFVIDIQEETNIDNLKDLIKDLNQGAIEIEKYFTNQLYKKLIDNLAKVAKIKTLKNLTIELFNNEKLPLNLKAIEQISLQLPKIIQSKLFNEIISYNQLRAFDEKNKRVLLDADIVYHLHLEEKEFNELYKFYQNKIDKINIIGNFKSTQTIDVKQVKKTN